MAQSPMLAGAGTAANRFNALTVFVAPGRYFNCTFFTAPIAHDPVNVQIRNTFADRGSSPSRMT
jgi:hypothetical protein